MRRASTAEGCWSIIRVHLLPAFGDAPLETITVDNGRPTTPRMRDKVLNVLHGVFKRAKRQP